jgi:hypothetical protein
MKILTGEMPPSGRTGASQPHSAVPAAGPFGRLQPCSGLADFARNLWAAVVCLFTGKVRVTGWVNVYRSGYYHRAGKPNMFDRHPGDLYPTRAAALADIAPEARHLYVGTSPTTWWEDCEPHVNSACSRPVPVISSRRQLARESGEYVDGVWTPASVLQEQRIREMERHALYMQNVFGVGA